MKTGLLAFTFSAILTMAAAQASGSATTTRYWDCCKGSCAWSEKAPVTQPLGTCDASDNPISDPDADSGCDGGSAFMCSKQHPWAIDNNTAYGFSAVNIAGGDESSWCCACYQLTFTSGAVAGKTMIVQATNTGGDLGANQFDLAIPGGGQGIFSGCSTQYGGSINWGDQYGGVHSADECAGLPEPLQDGCYWRFEWFMNADNPTADFTQVDCPADLTDLTGCVRTG